VERFRNDKHDGLDYLRSTLRLWGLVCRRMGVGFSSMSSHEKARIGRGGLFDGLNIPDWLAHIDHGVAASPPQHKLMLVEHYTKHGGHAEHMARLRQNHIIILSKSAYYRKLNTAEAYLNTRLSGGSQDVSCA
jgi:hypothetical protein